jgi:hypothetical protein
MFGIGGETSGGARVGWAGCEGCGGCSGGTGGSGGSVAMGEERAGAAAVAVRPKAVP